MGLSERQIEGVGVALNESDVLGFRPGPDQEWVDVLVEVMATPTPPRVADDPRRILRLHAPGRMEFLLRETPSGAGEEDGPAIPIDGWEALESVFATMSWSGSMYGWEFVVRGEHSDRLKPLSWAVNTGSTPRAHTFDWFNEFGRAGRPTVRMCIEGRIAFNELTWRDAEAERIPFETAVAEGQTWWNALFSEKHGSSPPQRSTRSWRPHLLGNSQDDST